MTERSCLLWIGFLLGIASARPVVGYELRTHGEITKRAFEISNGVQGYLKALGLDTTSTLSVAYATRPRQLAGFVNTGTLRDWMIEGAIREDDFKKRPDLAAFGCVQPENPPSELDRPRHHFFDVQRGGRGLTVLGQTIGLPALDWALGRQGRGPNPDQNQFSLLDARDYQLQSLTATTRADRDYNTARLFRTLGQVVHALEDMGAPQHTRNDPHLGCLEFIAGGHSWYEDYIETRTRGQRFLTRGEISRPLILDGYDAVAKRPYEQFFTHLNRAGLADFSSRNFFSAGTNLSVFGNCGGLPEPACEPGVYGTELRSFSIRALDGTVVSGTVTLYTHDVVDALREATIPGVPLSTRSVWDEHLETRQLLPLFSLNTINYDAAADILLPRAVGYAAGVLDTFFRGRVEIQAAQPYDDHFQVQLVNRTPDETMDGTFELYYDTPTGDRKYLTGWTLTLAPNTPSGWLDFPPPPPDQATAQLGQVVLVFRGRLGDEANAVAAATLPVGAYVLILAYGTNSFGYAEDYGLLSPNWWSPFPSGFITFYYRPGVDETYTRVGPTAGTPSGWEARGGAIWALVRNPAVFPGPVAYLSIGGVTGSDSYCETFVIGADIHEVTSSAATFEIVEYELPDDMARLQAFTWSSPPPVRRSYGQYSLSRGQAINLTLPIDGARLLGVRLTNPVPTPPPPADGVVSSSFCSVFPVLMIPREQ